MMGAAAVAAGLLTLMARETPAHADAEAEAKVSVGAEAKEGEAQEGEGKHEEVGKAGLDLVLGWGKVPFAVLSTPATGPVPNPTYTYADKVPSNVQSFILGGSMEIMEHVEVGARLPFSFAGFSPDGTPGRSATSFGNLELEGAYGGRVAEGLRLTGSLGLALPTAQGTEVPPDLNVAATYVDQSAYDRWSLNRAAAAARGYEDNALFEPNRLGIIPKVGLLYRTHGLSLEPYLKIENLISTSSSLTNSYVGELVGGLRVGYWVHKEFEVALRGWVNVGYAGADDDKKTTVAIEPQAVLRFGPVRPYLGVIIPFTGPPNDGGFVGLRLGVDVAF